MSSVTLDVRSDKHVYVRRQRGRNLVVWRSTTMFLAHTRLSLCLVVDDDQHPALAYFLNIDAGRAPQTRVRHLDQVETPHEAN